MFESGGSHAKKTSTGYAQLEMSTHSTSGLVEEDEEDDLHTTDEKNLHQHGHDKQRLSSRMHGDHSLTAGEQIRHRHVVGGTPSLRLEHPDDLEMRIDTTTADERLNTMFTSSSPRPLTFSLFNRDVKAILDGITKQQTMMLVVLFVLSTIVLVNLTLLVSVPLPVDTKSTSILQLDNFDDSFAAKTIAFGSCSSYDLRDMTVFTDAIIPTQPDAWIWTGDFVYLDDSTINCEIYQASAEWQESCNCTATWFANPPYSCHAGDVNYAKQRWLKGISNGKGKNYSNY